MDNLEMQRKIESLEKELENFRKKEEYTKTGLQRTKSVYEIARKNAEIIISKSVALAHDFKKDIEDVLTNIERNPLEFTKYLEEFIDKNDHFLNNKDEQVKLFLDEVINNLEK
ncbi:hypothetical protein [Spiroplasma monobiae]|uniref:Uncharacterized protein n=1 Tax=Spiroplasma monobiae MQ-1 TaxID=1336748 RepID=A0A2K9LUW4_SPISQ|nr:hypothetical protein [Spiroplasma monobiae]AUM62837.1 hypothetical protein SMONO_v1c05880 [Spiroplasma monobiae MQ-1]